jgi:hypothetical protein
MAIGHVAIPFLLGTIDRGNAACHRRFQKGHRGGPGLAGDIFFNHVWLTIKNKMMMMVVI